LANYKIQRNFAVHTLRAAPARCLIRIKRPHQAPASNHAKDTRLGPVDALWHLLNFFAPAVGVGLLASALAKLLWRRELKGTTWRRLSLWATACCAAALVAGLVVFGHDGKMATYAAMVTACALALWWVGFGPHRR
jgi:Flp pilus assembly protein TadB